MTSKITCGLFLPLKLHNSTTSSLESFAPALVDLAKKEPGTIQWLLKKFAGSETDYGVFDAFVDADARKAHLKGPMVAALRDRADWGPSELLRPTFFRVLASKTGPTSYEGTKGGVEVGIQVLLKARADKISEVEQFLTGALPLVEAEPLTTHWTAFHVPDSNIFGIVDSFPSEEGRQAHLQGKVAEALFAKADEYFEEAPDVKLYSVVGGNIN